VSASAIYAYVGNDPLNRVDPRGLAAEQNQSDTVQSDLFDPSTGSTANGTQVAQAGTAARAGAAVGMVLCDVPCAIVGGAVAGAGAI